MSNKLIGFTPKMEEMVKKIQDNNALPSFTAAVHFAIAIQHAKENPAYMTLKANETPAERVKRKAQEKEAKADIVRSDQLAVLEKLGGKLEMRQGAEVAVYYTYSGKKRYEQAVSLNLLSTDLIKTQYQPNRAKVEQLQKEGKTDY